MSVSLRRGKEHIAYCLRSGYKKGDIEEELKKLSGYTKQGDFIPRYWNNEELSRPGMCFDMEGKIDLSIENLKKLDALTKRRGLELLFDEATNKAIIGYKRRLPPWPKTIIEVCASGNIIVKEPDYVSYSQDHLLEEIGNVFGIKS